MNPQIFHDAAELQLQRPSAGSVYSCNNIVAVCDAPVLIYTNFYGTLMNLIPGRDGFGTFRPLHCTRVKDLERLNKTRVFMLLFAEQYLLTDGEEIP